MAERTQKTKVLFAFGRHGTESGQSADTEFFKKAVEPFLERCALLEGRQAVIIKEGIVFGFFALNPGRMDAAIRLSHEPRTKSNSKKLKEMRERIMRSQDYQLEAMKADYMYMDNGFQLPCMHEWGFEALVAEINSRHPHRVRSVPEYQTPETLIAAFEEIRVEEFFNAIKDDPGIHRRLKLRILAESLRKGICVESMRDALVLKQISDIAHLDAGAAIVVPRGFLHFPMMSRMDRERFDIEVRYGTRGINKNEEGWRIRAYANLYQGKLDAEGLLEFLEANADWGKTASRHKTCENDKSKG